MTEAEPLVAGAILGLANAAHCAGMCGVFALRASSAGTGAGARGALGFSAYALGKTATYVALGAIAGSLGAQALRALGDAQAWIALAAGAILVLYGLRMFRAQGAAGPLGGFLAGPVSEATAWASATRSRFLFGAATGLVPCGVVYLAAIQSAAWGTPVRGAISMAGFGLGTIPALAAAALMGRGALAAFGARRLRTAGACLVVLTGAVLVWRAATPILSGGGAGCCH